MEFTTMLELMPTLSEDPIRHNYNNRCIAADQGCVTDHVITSCATAQYPLLAYEGFVTNTQS